MFHFRDRGALVYLQSTALNRFDFLSHAFFSRLGGASPAPFASLNVDAGQGDQPANVRQNLHIISQSFGFAVEDLILGRQVHGDTLHVLTARHNLPAGDMFEGDGFITDRPGLVLCVKTADCVPVFLADERKKIVAALHAGWRGTALGIAGKAVHVLRERFASAPEDLWAAIGPAIGPCCYEVDERVCHRFGNRTEGDGFLKASGKKGRWMMDLALANRLQLEGAGVSSGRIGTSGVCTSCRRDLFFSHRGEGETTGRQLNFIMVRG